MIFWDPNLDPPPHKNRTCRCACWTRQKACKTTTTTTTTSWESLGSFVLVSSAISFRDSCCQKRTQWARNVASWWAPIGIDLWALMSLDIFKEEWMLVVSHVGGLCKFSSNFFWRFYMFFQFGHISVSVLAIIVLLLRSLNLCRYPPWFSLCRFWPAFSSGFSNGASKMSPSGRHVESFV